MKKSEYYKDILIYIEARLNLMDTMIQASKTKNYNEKQLYLYMVEQRQNEIDRWLSQEVEIKRS